jgi:[ribosomal protein S18]-alanine N-acetyltransferase
MKLWDKLRGRWRGEAAPFALVKPLDVSHASQAAWLHAQAFPYPWDIMEFERLFSEKSCLADGLFLKLAAQPCGFVLSRLVLDEAEILTLALDVKQRGQGFSKPLLKTHIENLNHRGVRYIHLEVEDSNHPAIRLYQGFGFVKTGERASYYAKSDGTRGHALSMTLTLPLMGLP